MASPSSKRNKRNCEAAMPGYRTSPTSPGKCTPQASCICAAIILGQSTAMMCRSSGMGSAGPCSVPWGA
jgi:hypothetical protein